MKGSCILGEHKIRFIDYGSEIWDTLSPETLSLAQCQQSGSDPLASSSLSGEKGLVHVSSVPAFQGGSPENWILSCGSWSSDGSSTVQPPGEECRWQLELVNSITPPLPQQRANRLKAQLPASPWGGKSWPRHPNFPGAAKRLASDLPVSKCWWDL